MHLNFKKIQKIFCLSFLIGILISLTPSFSVAQGNEDYAPTLTGISLNSGYTYDPSDNTFFALSLFKLFDYDKIWFHNAPKNLRFKVEIALGGAYLKNDDVRLIANIEMLAMYYMESLATKRFTPYIEGGIGVIYTDHRVKDQAYRFNFNPQAGIGLEFNRKDNENWFISLRAHHLSNGGLNSSNRGQNSVVFILGQYF